MRLRLPAIAAIIVSSSIVFAGCSLSLPESPTGGSTESATPAAPASPDTGLDAEPATGETIKGSEYTYVVPEGWGKPPEPIPGFSPDSFAANLQDKDGFADNVSAIAWPGAENIPLNLLEASVVSEFEKSGATDVKLNDRVTVAGSEAAHVTATGAGATSYITEQYYVSSDDQTYVVTFSFNDTMTSTERTKVTESVLVTWKWL